MSPLQDLEDNSAINFSDSVSLSCSFCLVTVITSPQPSAALYCGQMILRKVPMTSRCVNPQCAAQWELFGAGALYAFERRKTAHSSRQRKYIWLCAFCANRSTLETDATGNVMVVPQTSAGTSAQSDLRLVFRSPGVPLLLISDVGKQGVSSVRSWGRAGGVLGAISGIDQRFGGRYANPR